jgi:hypothetical protein
VSDQPGQILDIIVPDAPWPRGPFAGTVTAPVVADDLVMPGDQRRQLIPALVVAPAPVDQDHRVARAAGLVREPDTIYFHGWHLTIPLRAALPHRHHGPAAPQVQHSQMQATWSHCQDRVKTPLTPSATAAVVRDRRTY